ncbi:hypothetical protein ACP4OV_007602 [Aristida adscensionis]
MGEYVFFGATFGVNLEGFPALLRSAHAKFQFEPRYSVFARSVGYGVEDFAAEVVVLPHPFEQGFVRRYWGRGSSMDVAVHMAAWAALARLRCVLPELAKGAFRYFPAQEEGDDISNVAHPDPMADLLERHQATIVRAYDRALRSLAYVAREWRREVVRLQRMIEPYTRNDVVPRFIYDGPPTTFYDRATPTYRFPSVALVRPPSAPPRARRSVGLRFRRYPSTEETADSLLGPFIPLGNPEQLGLE